MPVINLLHKYDQPLPRYTSYPTVPYWDSKNFSLDKWKESVIDTFRNENGELSIYIHLPYCENLCTFCACNKRITTNHQVELPYLHAVLKEWEMYTNLLPHPPIIREIHLGGGTPTFFSPDNLELLIKSITNKGVVPSDKEFSIEVHPNYTTEEHLAVLSKLGFKRISIGIQDFDPEVQEIINRVQTFEKTKEVTDWARKYNYDSINVDLIYGLPRQTVSSIFYTIEKLKILRPDRIAFYSYAFVPWKSKAQRRYTEADLPLANDKWEMYLLGRNLLTAEGYKTIGMDHFALPDDKLFAAASNGRLHRNFMGYTTTQSSLIVGLGASAISDTWTAFGQNEIHVEDYRQKINDGMFPIAHGHVLNEEDLYIRKKIIDLMCRNQTTLSDNSFASDVIEKIDFELKLLQNDGLITYDNGRIVVTENGRLFIRNICAVLDARLKRKQIEGNVFSKAI